MAIQQSVDHGLRELALFAGAGGGILGGKLLGWRTVCAVELDAYCAWVLAQRQNDGCLEPFPIWDDVRTFDGRPWRGRVDVVSGGFPCQDISCAGKGAGIGGARSGLWEEMRRIISEVRPRYAFVENSPRLAVLGGTRVIGDFAEMGYDARWGIVSAENAGAPHKRERIWIVADTDNGGTVRGEGGTAHEVSGKVCKVEEQGGAFAQTAVYRPTRREPWGWWSHEHGLDRMADGVAHYMDRLTALGNGQVPAVAALAWKLLSI